MPLERHASLISLPDFRIANSSLQKNPSTALPVSSLAPIGLTDFHSYLSAPQNYSNGKMHLNSHISSLENISTKLASRNIDLAAAFRHQTSSAGVAKPPSRQKAGSIYSITTSRSSMQYKSLKVKSRPRVIPRESGSLQIHHHPLNDRRASHGKVRSRVVDDPSDTTNSPAGSNYSEVRRSKTRHKSSRNPSPIIDMFETNKGGYIPYTQCNLQRHRSDSSSITNIHCKHLGPLHYSSHARHRSGRHHRYYYSGTSCSRPFMQVISSTDEALMPITSLGQVSRNSPSPIMPSYYDSHSMSPSAPFNFSMQQTGEMNQYSALSPIASRSLLTCSREFQGHFPNVYAGLCKGLIDVGRLIQHEVVIPIKEEVALHKNAIRTRRAVTAVISEQLWKPLHGKFPDPAVAPKLIKRVSEYFFDKIETGIQQAEDERSFLQWLLRFDVENAIEIRVATSFTVGSNSTIANVEGAAHIKRRKGDCFSLLNPDIVTVDMDIIVKALFLNGGQLKEINNDPMFVDRIRTSGNRFATSFVNAY